MLARDSGQFLIQIWAKVGEEEEEEGSVPKGRWEKRRKRRKRKGREEWLKGE